LVTCLYMCWPIDYSKRTLSDLYSNLEILWNCKNWINTFRFFIFYNSFKFFPHCFFFFVSYKILSFQFLSKNILKCLHNIWITFFFLCFFLWFLLFFFWNSFFFLILFINFLYIVIINCLNPSYCRGCSTLRSFNIF
jgi:hypothetical protein